VRRQHQVAAFARIGRSQVLPHAFLQLLPRIARHDLRVDVDGRNLGAWVGRGRAEDGRGVIDWA
jgi:hypothetical protein